MCGWKGVKGDLFMNKKRIQFWTVQLCLDAANFRIWRIWASVILAEDVVLGDFDFSDVRWIPVDSPPEYRVTAGHQPSFYVLHQIAFCYDKPDHDAFCHSASPTGPAETHLFK